MQTFLTHPLKTICAKNLDRLRLGKQRTETMQLVFTIAPELKLYARKMMELGKIPTLKLSASNKGWVNHPAAVMWRKHEFALIEYGIQVCWEWERRGYEDNVGPLFEALRQYIYDSAKHGNPGWWNDERIFSSHRAALKYKAKMHAENTIRELDCFRRCWLEEIHKRRTTADDPNYIIAEKDFMRKAHEAQQEVIWYDQWKWPELPVKEYIWPGESNDYIEAPYEG